MLEGGRLRAPIRERVIGEQANGHGAIRPARTRSWYSYATVTRQIRIASNVPEKVSL